MPLSPRTTVPSSSGAATGHPCPGSAGGVERAGRSFVLLDAQYLSISVHRDAGCDHHRAGDDPAPLAALDVGGVALGTDGGGGFGLDELLEDPLEAHLNGGPFADLHHIKGRPHADPINSLVSGRVLTRS